MNQSVPQVPRRQLLLGVGALALLSACGTGVDERPPARQPSPSPSGSARGSVHGQAKPGPQRAVTYHEQAPTQRPSSAGQRNGDVDAPEYDLSGGGRKVALTIDDGPDPKYTPLMLALLHSHGIRATFCMIGFDAQRHPDLVREVHAQGHLIANHTWNHADLTRLSPGVVQDEILHAQEAITAAAGGTHPTLFRAPYGAWSDSALRTCAQLGLRPLDWSVDPRDWSRPGTSRIIQTILRTTRPGSIILEHDGGGDRSETVAALRVVLPRLLDAGYTFGTP
jgi:peptidoglycan-N-acetylglucosamine deacetylase